VREAERAVRPFVRDEGDGTPLVLLHGFGLDGTAWDDVVARLRPGIRILRPDARGLGRSADLPGPYTVERMADDVVDLLDERGLARAAIVGHSMGGVVAADVARRAPERVAALGLVGSRIDPDTPEQERRRLALADAAERDGIGVIAAAYVPKFFAPATVAARPELAERALALMRASAGPSAPALFAGTVRRFDGRAVLAALDVPVLVVTGDADGFFGVDAQRSLADAAAHATLLVLGGVGHFAPWEAPDAVARAVEELLDRV